MITSAQIRAARALLNWSRGDLSIRSGISLPSITRLESFQGVPSSYLKTLEAIKKAFEEAGVRFIGAPDDNPGVRLLSK